MLTALFSFIFNLAWIVMVPVLGALAAVTVYIIKWLLILTIRAYHYTWAYINAPSSLPAPQPVSFTPMRSHYEHQSELITELKERIEELERRLTRLDPKWREKNPWGQRYDSYTVDDYTNAIKQQAQPNTADWYKQHGYCPDSGVPLANVTPSVQPRVSVQLNNVRHYQGHIQEKIMPDGTTYRDVKGTITETK